MRLASSNPVAIAVLSLGTCCLLLQDLAAYSPIHQDSSAHPVAQLAGGPEGTGVLPFVGPPLPTIAHLQFLAQQESALAVGIHRKATGGSDGAGSLPYAGGANFPAGPSKPCTIATLGVVTDTAGNAVSGALVVASHPAIGIVGQAVTDENGGFVLCLPKAESLELALPDAGVAGVEVTAGSPTLIIIP